MTSPRPAVACTSPRPDAAPTVSYRGLYAYRLHSDRLRSAYPVVARAMDASPRDRRLLDSSSRPCLTALHRPTSPTALQFDRLLSPVARLLARPVAPGHPTHRALHTVRVTFAEGSPPPTSPAASYSARCRTTGCSLGQEPSNLVGECRVARLLDHQSYYVSYSSSGRGPYGARERAPSGARG